jgi:hypothetical protein
MTLLKVTSLVKESSGILRIKVIIRIIIRIIIY